MVIGDLSKNNQKVVLKITPGMLLSLWKLHGCARAKWRQGAEQKNSLEVNFYF